MQTADKGTLLRRVRDLEEAALEQHVASAFACLQDGRFLSDRTRQLYAELQARGADVLLLGRGLTAWLPGSLQGVDLTEEDPLADEWLIAITGSASVCLAARDLQTRDAPSPDRTFEYSVTTDPGLVGRVAALLETYR